MPRRLHELRELLRTYDGQAELDGRRGFSGPPATLAAAAIAAVPGEVRNRAPV